MLQFGLKAFARLAPLLLAIVFIGLAPGSQAHAQNGTAKQFLQTIYTAYMGPQAVGVRWRGPTASRYFDPALTKLIAKDLKESEGEVGRMDMDPFVDAQDFDISSLKIEILSEDADQAKATASFTNLSQPTRVEYDLVRTSQGWRIANIAWPSQKGRNLKSVMSGPLLSE